MKLLGAMLLTAAGVCAGLGMTRSLRARAEACDELCRMLALMEFELDRFLTPLPELFEKLSERLSGLSAGLCTSVAESLEAGLPASEAWERAADRLPKRERELLRPLGGVLGQYGAREQIAAISACRNELWAFRDELRAELRSRGRVYVGAAAAGALMLSVMLF